MISALATVHVAGSDHGGVFTAHQPRVIVAHSVEAPIKRGQAKFRMELLAARKNASGHYLVDPGAIASGVEEEYIAWGAGTVNPAAIHVEFMGYASYTRAQWTTPDGLAMLRLGGELIADIAGRRGIPLRWLTDAQLLAAWKGQGPGGLTTHDQCRRVIGGTTHYDPGDGFPKDLLLQYATQGDDDMPLTDADIDRIATATAAKILGTPLVTTDYSVRPPKPRKGTVLSSLKDNSNFSSGAAYNAGQASNAAKAALAELQEGMKA